MDPEVVVTPDEEQKERTWSSYFGFGGSRKNRKARKSRSRSRYFGVGGGSLKLIDGTLYTIKDGNVYEYDEMAEKTGDFVGRLKADGESIDTEAEEKAPMNVRHQGGGYRKTRGRKSRKARKSKNRKSRRV